MPSAFRAELSGLRQVQANLANLRKTARNGIVRPAMAAALKPVLAAVKERVPTNSGLLLKALARKVVATGSGIMGLVGARSDLRETVIHRDGSEVLERPALILHLVEGGRKAVAAFAASILSAGGSVAYGTRAKAVDARHPLLDGWQASKDAAAATLAERIQVGIANAVARGKL